MMIIFRKRGGGQFVYSASGQNDGSRTRAKTHQHEEIASRRRETSFSSSSILVPSFIHRLFCFIFKFYFFPKGCNIPAQDGRQALLIARSSYFQVQFKVILQYFFLRNF